MAIQLRLLKEYQGGGHLHWALLSPDESCVLLMVGAKQIELRDAKTGWFMNEPIHIPYGVKSIEFSEDSKTILVQQYKNYKNVGSDKSWWRNVPDEPDLIFRIKDGVGLAEKDFMARLKPAYLEEVNVANVHERGFQVLEAKTGKKLAYIKEPFPDYGAAAISYDGRKVAIGYMSGHLRLINLDQIEKPLFLYGHDSYPNDHMHQNSIKHLDFSGCGRFLSSVAEEDFNPRIWDLSMPYGEKVFDNKPANFLKEALELGQMEGEYIESVRFGGHSTKFMTTANYNKTARLWEIII